MQYEVRGTSKSRGEIDTVRGEVDGSIVYICK